MARGYHMSADELRRHMEELKILPSQLASMLGILEHGARRYTMNGEGNRNVPPSLALLLRLLKLHPEQVAEVMAIAAGDELPMAQRPEAKEEKEITK